jgi:hypothetical protein
VVEVKQDEGGSDDLSDPPWIQADVAQRLERHFQYGVTALADGPQPVVGLVEYLLHAGECAVLGLLERHGDSISLAFVAEVAEGAQTFGDGGEGGQDLGVGAYGGGVVLPATPGVGPGVDTRSVSTSRPSMFTWL